jgi:hypothetical protein
MATKQTTTLRLDNKATLDALQAAKINISAELGKKLTNDDLIMYLLSTNVSNLTKSNVSIDTVDTSKIDTVDTFADYISRTEYDSDMKQIRDTVSALSKNMYHSIKKNVSANVSTDDLEE